MRIEAVVVCVGYADFLCWSLPLNRQHFDDMVVVTSTEDERTARVCEVYNVRCVKTNIFKEEFNKGAGINLGLAQLKCTDWVVHLDADIVLPSRFREMLKVAQIEPENIYGCSRMNAVGFRAWLQYFTNPRPLIHKQIYVFNDIFPMSPTISKLWPDLDFEFEKGYLPLGYLQIWNQGLKKMKYPEQHGDAARGDMEFALQWPRKNRILIPEINVTHLVSKDGVEQGKNWGGRMSAPFDLTEIEGCSTSPS